MSALRFPSHLLLSVIIFIFSSFQLLLGQNDFSRLIGKSNGEHGYETSQTIDGGFIIAGATRSITGNDWDYYLVKTDSQGKTEWEKAYGSSGDETAESIIQTFDGGYAIAGMARVTVGAENMSVAKFDSTGQVLWSKVFFENGSGRGSKIIQLADGSLLVLGYDQQSGQGGLNVILMKLDIQGKVIWSRTYDSGKADYGYDLKQSSNDGFIISGKFNGFEAGILKTNAKGNFVWAKSYPLLHEVSAVLSAADGGLVLAGNSTILGPQGGENIFLSKIDSTGHVQWNKIYGGSNDDNCYALAQTSTGYILAGYTQSFGPASYNGYLLNTDSIGNLNWSEVYDGSSWDYFRDIKKTTTNNFIITGWGGSFSQGGYDILLIKTDSTGHLNCLKMGTQTQVFDSLIGSRTLSLTIDSTTKIGSPLNLITHNLTSVNNSFCPNIGLEWYSAQPNLTVYPNPTKSLINITCENCPSETLKLTMYNSLGIEVTLKSLNPNMTIALVTDNLKSGIYLLQVHHNGKIVATNRVIIH